MSWCTTNPCAGFGCGGQQSAPDLNRSRVGALPLPAPLTAPLTMHPQSAPLSEHRIEDAPFNEPGTLPNTGISRLSATDELHVYNIATQFGRDSATLTTADRARIADFARRVRPTSGDTASIVGNSSSECSGLTGQACVQHNDALSQRRANAVRSALQTYWPPGVTYTAVGVGSRDVIRNAAGVEDPIASRRSVISIAPIGGGSRIA